MKEIGGMLESLEGGKKKEKCSTYINFKSKMKRCQKREIKNISSNSEQNSIHMC